MDFLFSLFSFCVFLCNSSMYKVYLTQIYSSKMVILLLLINVLFGSIGKIYGTFVRQMPMRLISYFFLFQFVVNVIMMIKYRPLTIASFVISTLFYGLQSSIIFNYMDNLTERWNIYKHKNHIIQFVFLVCLALILSWFFVKRINVFFPLIVSVSCGIYFFQKSKNEHFNIHEILDHDDRLQNVKFIVTSILINFISSAILFIINTESYLIWHFAKTQIVIIIAFIKILFMFLGVLMIHTTLFIKPKQSLYINVFYMINFIELKVKNKYLQDHFKQIKSKMVKLYIYEIAGDILVLYKYKQNNQKFQSKIIGYISNIFI